MHFGANWSAEECLSCGLTLAVSTLMVSSRLGFRRIGYPT